MCTQKTTCTRKQHAHLRHSRSTSPVLKGCRALKVHFSGTQVLVFGSHVSWIYNNLHPKQHVPKTTCTQNNMYPKQHAHLRHSRSTSPALKGLRYQLCVSELEVKRSRFLVFWSHVSCIYNDLHPKQHVPKTTCTQSNMYPKQHVPKTTCTKTTCTSPALKGHISGTQGAHLRHSRGCGTNYVCRNWRWSVPDF